MKTFSYRAMNAQGQLVSDTIEEVSEDSAQAKIRSAGYFVTSIRELGVESEDVKEPPSKQWQFSIFNYKLTLTVENNE